MFYHGTKVNRGKGLSWPLKNILSGKFIEEQISFVMGNGTGSTD